MYEYNDAIQYQCHLLYRVSKTTEKELKGNMSNRFDCFQYIYFVIQVRPHNYHSANMPKADIGEA